MGAAAGAGGAVPRGWLTRCCLCLLCHVRVKIDNCGASHNVTLWAELFNKSGKPIRIESCHTVR